jgi:biopolymer transport protein ExbD
MDIRNRKFKAHGAEVKTDALNDILFILMFFFLMISLVNNNSSIKLNQPKMGKTEEKNDTRVRVEIDIKNQFYVNSKPVANDVELYSLLKSELDAVPATQPTIAISMDSTVPVYYMTKVIKIGNSLNAKSVLVTAKPK